MSTERKQQLCLSMQTARLRKGDNVTDLLNLALPFTGAAIVNGYFEMR
jgi:hypothetical protein